MRQFSTVSLGCSALRLSALAVVTVLGSQALPGALPAGQAPVVPADAARAAQNGEAKSRIEELERDLDSAGPEGRDQRESAVLQLLAMTEPAAHAVLHKRLRRGDDLERVTRFILARLAGRLRSSTDRVLGRAHPDPAARAKLTQSYIAPLVECADRAEQAEATPADRSEFRGALVRCFAAFEPRDRAAGFEPLLAAEGERRRTAVRAARFTRDLGLARRLGELLDQVRGTERVELNRSLAELTLHPLPFADGAAFRRWYQAEVVEGRRDFVDLAVRSWRAERDRRGALELELLVSLVRQADPDWSRLRTALRSGDDRQVINILRGIQPVLVGRASPGGDAAKRREVITDLLEADSTPSGRTARGGLAREIAAYLIDAAAVADRELAQRVQAALLEDVASGAVVRQEPALRGLRRFPTADSRSGVVAAVARTLPVAATGKKLEPGAARVLQAGLATLAADRWTAPGPGDAGAEAWLGLLQRVLRHPATDLDQRQLAATVLTRPMASGVSSAAGLAALAGEVNAAEQLVDLRVFALMHLHGVASQDLDGFAQTLIRSLAPTVPSALRTHAAQLLARVPVEAGDEGRVVKLADAAIAQILQETDTGGADALAEGLKRLAERHREPDRIAAALVDALAAVKPGAEPIAAQTQIVEVVRVIVARPECDAQLWVRAGELLVGGLSSSGGGDADKRVGLNPDVARSVLDQHPVSRLIEAKADPALIQRAHRLVVAVATHKPADSSWANRVEESTRVRESLAALEAAKKLPRDAATTLLRIELASENGNHRRALEFADQLPEASDEGFTLELRRRAAIALGRSSIDRDRIPEAVSYLESLGKDDAEAVLQLHEGLGDKYLAREAWPEAIVSYQRALQPTKADGPKWASRLLKLAQAYTAADRETELSALVRKHAPRFQKTPPDPAVTDDQRTTFQAFAERVRAGGGG